MTKTSINQKCIQRDENVKIINSTKRLYEFLENYKKDKNNKKHDNLETSLTMYGSPWGSYHIPDNEYQNFLNLYSKCLGYNGLHLIERPLEIGPLLFDIDFNYLDNSQNGRIYSMSDIRNLVGIINKSIRKYYKCTNISMRSFIFEKSEPTEKDEYFKDGFHIVYPNLPMSIKMRYLITFNLMNEVNNKDLFAHIPHTNDIDDVFDSSVIKANGWTMYGSHKDKGPFYRLTKIYSFNSKKVENSYKNSDLVSILSNRRYKNESELSFNSDLNKDTLNEEIKKALSFYDVNECGNKCKKVNNNIIGNDFDDDIFDKSNNPDDISRMLNDCKLDDEEIDNNYKKKTLDDINNKNNKNFEDEQMELCSMAKKLAMMLSPKRARNYTDWVKVGWALRGVSPKMLGVFKKFSQKDPSKYNETACDDIWKKAKKKGLSIGSLKHWAKKDNPDEYQKMITSRINFLLDKAKDGTEYDIAIICFQLYNGMFRCVSADKPMNWYEYQDHKWVDIGTGSTLRVKLSKELTVQFAKLGAHYLTMVASGDNADINQIKADRIFKLIKNLKRREFKNKVISECADIFYNFDTKFQERLDSNKHLIGFENGVYDLKNDEFRDGMPDDWISLNTGYDWKEYESEHYKIKEIEEYFSQVQPDQDMRDYVLILLASYLDGFTRNQQFIIWTGTGSNGKSKTVELFQNCFGEYCTTIPVTLLTKKRSDVGKATPELAGAKGRRFVVFNEPDGDDQIQVGFMKELTGGEKISVRPLYKNAYVYRPQFKLLLACNKLPHIPSTDGGTWRRLRVLPWESEFVDEPDPKKPRQFKRDYDLEEKLEKWKKAFAWYLIKKWYPKYIKGGLKEPAKVTKFTKSYKKQSDTFYEFIEENVTVTKNPKHKESITILYNAFKVWFTMSHSRKVTYDKKDLIDYFENNGYKMDKQNIYGIQYGMSDMIGDD